MAQCAEQCEGMPREDRHIRCVRPGVWELLYCAGKVVPDGVVKQSIVVEIVDWAPVERVGWTTDLRSGSLSALKESSCHYPKMSVGLSMSLF